MRDIEIIIGSKMERYVEERGIRTLAGLITTRRSIDTICWLCQGRARAIREKV